MDLALVNGRVMTERGLVEGLAVRLHGDRIAAIGPRAEVAAGAETRDLAGALLLPGFIDTQVNGGDGVLFNDAPTVGTIARIGAAHRRFGTTGFLPTLISDDLSVVGAAIEATRAAIAAGSPGVLGLHIEGPFLNARRRGIHDAAKLRRTDEASVALLASLGVGRTLVTLAPEASSLETIEQLVRAGVVVSAGHTDASYALIRAALDRGLTGFTHLFNAMSPLASRAPGVVGAALENQSAWSGIIVDGVHVDPVVLKLALRLRPHERFLLITDAMPCVGSGADLVPAAGQDDRGARRRLFRRDWHAGGLGARHGERRAQRGAVAGPGSRRRLADGEPQPGRVPRSRPRVRAYRTRLLRRPGVARRRPAGAGHLGPRPRSLGRGGDGGRLGRQCLGWPRSS